MECDTALEYILVGHDCKPCPGGANISAAVFGLVLVCIVILLIVFIVVLKTEEPPTAKVDKRSDRDHFVGEIVILISYMQIISVLARTFSGSVRLRKF